MTLTKQQKIYTFKKPKFPKKAKKDPVPVVVRKKLQSIGHPKNKSKQSLCRKNVDLDAPDMFTKCVVRSKLLDRAVKI
jgi:hypothetical protein